MTPWVSQIQMAKECYAILKKNGMAYLAGEERTGKLMAAVTTAEMCNNVNNVLVLTTKKALDGWYEMQEKYETNLNITILNYHQVMKAKGSYDLVILDECHNYLSAFPKPGGIWVKVRKVVYGLPILYSSATPHAQGPQMLYHQFALCAWSPWRDYQNGYHWFKEYGVKHRIYVYDREVEQYDTFEDERILAEVDHLFVSKTRAELGFEHEPEDVLHYVNLMDSTRKLYNKIVKDKVAELKGYQILYDTPMKLKTALHQLEGGAAKATVIADEKKRSIPLVLENTEKIDYIMQVWGDSPDVVIMYQYIAEGIKLRTHFQNAVILQATSFAEGVDLSEYQHLIIYSQDFKTSKHSQRRARQANKKRKDPIKVHFLLVEGAVSEQVYETVSINKENFVDSVFKRKAI